MKTEFLLRFCSFVALIQLATTRHATTKLNRRFRHNGNRDLNTLVVPMPKMQAYSETQTSMKTLKCPKYCTCQYANFKNLSISRWIHTLQQREESYSDNILDNETTYKSHIDELELLNPLIKQATCILQADSDPAILINSLPLDLQSLKLLYTGVEHDLMLNTSTLSVLNQLTTLEILGGEVKSKLRLIIDTPLSFLQHASFEKIQLLGSDKIKTPKNPRHPRDIFDYKPPSERYVATTSGDGQKKIDFELEADEPDILPYHEYKKSRMPAFYGWTALEVLRIHECQLNELQWEIFDGLTALQQLSLERNNIEFLPPFALFGALHIKNLSLAHNQLHKLHYHALAGLLELVELDLSDNRLMRLSELTFPPFPKLERIDFRNNPIRYIFPATFWIMNDTREMYFSSDKMALELWDNQPFDSLHKLQILSIENVSIGNLNQGIFKGLNSLESLKLRGDIYSIEFDAFADLRMLRQLDLSHCNINEISMDALMGCKQLEVLNLSHNNISYIPPDLLEDQQQLQDVYLEHNQLRTLPKKFFLQPKLRVARLHNNAWHCTCEMSNWQPKITNAVRGTSTESCITDYMTGKKLSCRPIENFNYNKTLVPRCTNFNERSVFYVLRKQLDCAKERMQHNRKHQATGRPLWLKLQQAQQKQNMLQNGKFSVKRFKNDENQLFKKMWANHSNTLDSILQQQEEQQLKQHEYEAATLMSNDI